MCISSKSTCSSGRYVVNPTKDALGLHSDRTCDDGGESSKSGESGKSEGWWAGANRMASHWIGQRDKLDSQQRNKRASPQQ
jgi:hypothetical protein